MENEETLICKDCGQQIEYLGEFPGPRCLSCHARKFDREVALTGRLPKPNFAKTLNLK